LLDVGAAPFGVKGAGFDVDDEWNTDAILSSGILEEAICILLRLVATGDVLISGRSALAIDS